MNPKLKAIVGAIDFYQSTYPEDACILIFDTEKVVGYKRGKHIDLKIKIGETVEQHRNTTSIRAMSLKNFLALYKKYLLQPNNLLMLAQTFQNELKNYHNMQS